MAAAKRRSSQKPSLHPTPRPNRSPSHGPKMRRSDGRSSIATPPRKPAKKVEPGVYLERSGLRLIDGSGATESLPLRAGAVHYFRLAPHAWRPALDALVTMGLGLVETYIPWQVHERGGENGEALRYEFTGQLDVAAFLREAHELGLRAIIRPGPHINAELTDFGLPERVIWNPDCQARTPRQNPVFLPAPPRAFPVPSYASRAFLRETAIWFDAVGNQLRDLVWPHGPIVMVQVDNEGAFYFRDGIYDQDYHPDAVAHYRAFLRARYGTIDQLRHAYGIAGQAEAASDDFDALTPPLRYDVRGADDLPRHLDWAESHEVLLANAFGTMGSALTKAGLGSVPLFHNLPMGESATPLHPALVRRPAHPSLDTTGGTHPAPIDKAGEAPHLTPTLGGGIDLISLDYYHSAGDYRAIARRTGELAVVSDSLDHPAFGAEMGAGAPPFFPPLDERDAAFTVLCAMAYGLRGYNVYMAVERDRWLGSPVDRNGVLRPFAAFWRKLAAAYDQVRFGELVRDVPARIVVPRSVRRLARVMHAFGPVSQALFRVMGGGMQETVLEDGIDFGEGHTMPPPMRAGRILVAAERALEELGIPHAFVDGGDAQAGLVGARWVVVPTSCGLDTPVIEAARAAQSSGARVTFAPSLPRRDGTFRPLSAAALKALPKVDLLSGEEAIDRAAMRTHAVRALEGTARILATPAPCSVTVHQNAAGAPRAVFVINPTKSRQRVETNVVGVGRVRDLFDGTSHVLANGISVDASTVRFCEVVVE